MKNTVVIIPEDLFRRLCENYECHLETWQVL